MASNRFAALSPDFEEDEVQRKKQADAAKAKKEAMAAKAEEKSQEKKQEGPARTDERVPAERGRGRGRGRGTGRPYRARGGYRGGSDYHGSEAPAEGEFVSRDKPETKDVRDFKFSGNPNSVHPFDRRSGTGRGTEIPKRGGGRRNWGNPADDWKNSQRAQEEKPETSEKTPLEQPKEGEPKKDEVKEGEKKPEVPKVPEAPTYTYSEYQALLAEKQKGLEPVKKAEVQVTRDPKNAAGLIAYDKQKYSGLSEVAEKKKEPVKKVKEVSAEENKANVLGTLIDKEEKTFKHFDRKPMGEEASPEGERRSPAGKRGRGQFKETAPRPEAKKPEAVPFVMKVDEFPTF